MGISLLLLFSLAQLVKQSEMQHARTENQKANLRETSSSTSQADKIERIA